MQTDSTIVAKFGGTSVGSIERINHVADIISRTHADGARQVIVVSAMGGGTDDLIAMAHEINADAPKRETDVLLATGEQVSIALLSMALTKRGLKAMSFTGAQAAITTDGVFGKARIEHIDPQPLNRAVDNGTIAVVAGFQGLDADGNITTLGRGGSDTTAVALAAALKADECRIYTDVDGVYTADPRIVSDARRLDRMTIEEMLEIASLGAKVLETRSVELAGRYGLRLRVLSSFEPGPGTLITSEEAESMEQPAVSGIAHDMDEAKVTIRGVPDKSGIASDIFVPIAAHHINVDMIVQNIGIDGTTDLTFTVRRADLKTCQQVLGPVVKAMGASEVVGDETIAKVSAVGVGMRSHTGIAAKMFRTLAEEGINIQMISTSEIKISVVVEDKYAELAVRALHTAFELER